MPELFKVEKQFKLFEDIFPFSLEKPPTVYIFSLQNGGYSYFIIVYKVGYTVIVKNLMLKIFHLLVFDNKKYIFFQFFLLKSILLKKTPDYELISRTF